MSEPDESTLPPSEEVPATEQNTPATDDDQTPTPLGELDQ